MELYAYKSWTVNFIYFVAWYIPGKFFYEKSWKNVLENVYDAYESSSGSHICAVLFGGCFDRTQTSDAFNTMLLLLW